MFRFIPRKPIRLRTLPRQILGIGAELASWALSHTFRSKNHEQY